MTKNFDDGAEDNPWILRGSREVYKNPWIRVREDDVITPAGLPGIYGVVEAKPAVGVLALTSDDELYLVGQYRYALNRYSWEIAKGGGELGESQLETAQRELREETGLEADDWQRLPGENFLSNCFSNEEAFFFVARGLHEVPPEPDETERLIVRTVPFSTAVEMVLSGEITDAMSIIAILKYHTLEQMHR